MIHGNVVVGFVVVLFDDDDDPLNYSLGDCVLNTNMWRVRRTTRKKLFWFPLLFCILFLRVIEDTLGPPAESEPERGTDKTQQQKREEVIFFFLYFFVLVLAGAAPLNFRLEMTLNMGHHRPMACCDNKRNSAHTQP